MKKYNHDYSEFDNDIMKATNGILKDRGVDDWQDFINPSEKSIDTRILKNLDKASEMLLKHINAESRILILVDSDADGLTSASLCYDGIKDIASHFEKKPMLGIINHERKVHGVDMILHKLDGRYHKFDLLIAPDSSSSDIKGMRELDRRGKDFLILDHHPTDIKEEDIPDTTVLVNNTLEDISSGLSGVGIVYKLMKYIDDEHWIDFADEYLDILAMGLLGDSMKATDKEVNYFIRKGLKNIKNKLMVEIIGAKKLDSVTPKTINFDVNPKVNVIFRQGKLGEKGKASDKKLMFDGISKMGDNKRHKNGRAKSKDGTISAEHHFRLLAARTKKAEKAMVDSVDMDLVELSDNKKLGMLDLANTDLEGGIAGMLASKLSRKYNVPFLVYNSANKFKGSCRSPIGVRTLFNETGQLEWGMGHECAFGFQLNITFDINKIAKAVADYESDSMADLHISQSDINTGVVNIIGKINKNMYSPACKKITLYSMFRFMTDSVFVNESKTMMKIDIGGYDLVLFNPSDEIVDKAKLEGEIKCIVEPSINEFGGSLSYQMVIQEVM